MTVGWHLVGDDAVLVDLPGAAAVARLDAALRSATPLGVVDVVPAERTVLVRGSAAGRPRWADEVRRAAEASSDDTPWAEASSDDTPRVGASSGWSDHPARGWRPGSRLVEIPVHYDGADLAEVAALTGMTPDEVVARHVAGRYRVAFGGFVPGFAYLTGLDAALVVPRLSTPRTRVPAGAVAIGGEYTAVYPRATPGGWRLLGRTDAVMFDQARDERPALLAVGDEVRFVRARERLATPRAERPEAAADGRSQVPTLVGPGPTGRPRTPTSAGSAPSARPRIPPIAGSAPATPPLGALELAPGEHEPHGVEVLATGALVLVEDAGRAGLAALGVPRSGAADPRAMRAANRLVGNRVDAAVLEVVLGGLVVRFGMTTAIALTGAPAPAYLDGRAVPHHRAVRVPAGATLELGVPTAGLRTWVALRGGVAVPEVLGSRSTDVLSSLGPRPVAAGDVLPLGVAFDGLPEVGTGDDQARPATTEPDGAGRGRQAGPPEVVTLDAYPGPRLDLLDDDSRRRLVEQVWVVTPDSNRVALRLDGPALSRAVDEELPSEGLVLGSVQVPHDGRPVVFGPDHPVTGGYPVVAVLTPEGVARAAQCLSGDHIRLTIRYPTR